MIFYCIFRNTESLCDLRILLSLCQKMQHISFVAAEAVNLHELSLLQVSWIDQHLCSGRCHHLLDKWIQLSAILFSILIRQELIDRFSFISQNPDKSIFFRYEDRLLQLLYPCRVPTSEMNDGFQGTDLYPLLICKIQQRTKKHARLYILFLPDIYLCLHEILVIPVCTESFLFIRCLFFEPVI